MSTMAPSRFLAIPPDGASSTLSSPNKLRRTKQEKKVVKHRPESLEHAIKIAWCDWGAGLVIGLMPLLCHLLLHYAAKSAPDWDDNWAPDLLFITITNSGLVAVTVFTRMLSAHLSISSLTPMMRIIWGFTIVCFALASMLYGAAATGMSNRWTSAAALLFVIFSAYCSLTFELAVAREHFAPARQRARPPETEESSETNTG
jgi:small-conductance mechanosensitive channel